MTRCRVAIIADDLTGALDACAPFAARGADARVVVSRDQLSGVVAEWRDAPPEVVAINIESRHLSADAAAAQLTSAFQALAPLAPGLWFKKVDSTLRGQVIAECCALRDGVGLPLLLAPAVPAQGREVRGAEVWVDGVRLADSDYRHDARSTPLLGPLDSAFAAAGLPLERIVPQPGMNLPHCDGVVDATGDGDLAMLYDAVLRSEGDFCLAGAGGLAQAVAQRLFGCLLGRRWAIASDLPRLYVVGSRAPRSEAQCQALRQAVPELTGLTPAELQMAAWLPMQLLLRPADDEQRSPAQVAEALASAAAAWREAYPSGLLFATGGDTALAILERLEIGYLQVVAEWAPGVVVSHCDGDAQQTIITKAGGFGHDQLLVELHGVQHAEPPYAVSR
ncbi:four-carbon acid sugar kinase family protein [Halomonas sp. ML-15]|uniref:four-carbon acid sugar kinase family protein n=1 Tax=Halomonas sp. ML-15 TaxID=2773305 RepID=UPI001746B014|nr:four-carbon acid sugar kinase family protein [Halomonas sp. ML-15]MBD3897807.1 four-carbon acid sugar kinase family protein [Halomonas sp. ML-15]